MYTNALMKLGPVFQHFFEISHLSLKDSVEIDTFVIVRWRIVYARFIFGSTVQTVATTEGLTERSNRQCESNWSSPTFDVWLR